jgi:hypothetical protein
MIQLQISCVIWASVKINGLRISLFPCKLATCNKAVQHNRPPFFLSKVLSNKRKRKGRNIKTRPRRVKIKLGFVTRKCQRVIFRKDEKNQFPYLQSCGMSMCAEYEV